MCKMVPFFFLFFAFSSRIRPLPFFPFFHFFALGPTLQDRGKELSCDRRPLSGHVAATHMCLYHVQKVYSRGALGVPALLSTIGSAPTLRKLSLFFLFLFTPFLSPRFA